MVREVFSRSHGGPSSPRRGWGCDDRRRDEAFIVASPFSLNRRKQRERSHVAPGLACLCFLRYLLSCSYLHTTSAHAPDGGTTGPCLTHVRLRHVDIGQRGDYRSAGRSGLGFGEPLCRGLPVDQIPPGLGIVRPAILVLDVVGVLPDVDDQDRLADVFDEAGHKRVALV